MGPAAERIELPTPFATGTANVYLLEDDPLTLVDTGPRDPPTFAALEHAVRERGHALADVGLILLTHGHIDHVGNTRAIQALGGATVAAFGPLAPWLLDREGAVVAETSYRASILRLHGAPPAAIAKSQAEWARADAYSPGTITVHHPLVDGDVVRLSGRALRVAHRPGHSAADLLFVDDARRTAYGGDHVLARITPTAIVAHPLSGPADPRRRASAVSSYLESLRKTAELSLSVLLTGHGDPVANHRAIIDAHLIHLAERRADVLAYLETAPLTAWDVAARVWPRLERPFLMLSAAIGALDILVAEGRVELVEKPDTIAFRRSDLTGLEERA